MREEFLGLRNDVRLKHKYNEECFSGGKAATQIWRADSIEKMKRQSLDGTLIENYGGKVTAKLGGKHVAVVEEQVPLARGHPPRRRGPSCHHN